MNDKHHAARGKTVIMSLHSQGLDWAFSEWEFEFPVDSLAQKTPSPVVPLSHKLQKQEFNNLTTMSALLARYYCMELSS